MRTRCAVEEHGLGACDGHVEGAHFRLAVLERNMSTVHTGVHGRTGLVNGRLRDGVVSVAELELHDVAYSCDYRVRDEDILGATNDYRNDLVLTAVHVRPELGESGGRSREGEENADGLHGGGS